MTATLTADELVITALRRIHEVAKRITLDHDVNDPEWHANITDLAAARLALLTPPLRPSGAEDALVLTLEEVAADGSG